VKPGDTCVARCDEQQKRVCRDAEDERRDVATGEPPYLMSLRSQPEYRECSKQEAKHVRYNGRQAALGPVDRAEQEAVATNESAQLPKQPGIAKAQDRSLSSPTTEVVGFTRSQTAHPTTSGVPNSQWFGSEPTQYGSRRGQRVWEPCPRLDTRINERQNIGCSACCRLHPTAKAVGFRLATTVNRTTRSVISRAVRW